MKKILLIDDEADVRNLVDEALTEAGFTVLCAQDGESGLEMARRKNPDLILCDLWMPRLNGFQMLQALRQEPLGRTIPFIFLSADADRAQVRHGMEAGADDYLPKPFTIPELIGAVRGCLDRHAKIAGASEDRLNALRDSISFALPHEFMTPLDAILGFSTFLKDAPEVAREDMKDCAQRIHSAGLRLKRTVENFLLYSQIEILAADPERREALLRVDKIPADETIRLAAERRARAAGRIEDLELEVAPVQLAMEASKLEKVTAELCDNAFKFSPPGSPVKVRLKPVGKEMVLDITDAGRGFTPQQLRAVGAHMQFQRRMYEQQGAGLGLVIAKRLVELHGGSLLVESVPGQKTSITVKLPLAD